MYRSALSVRAFIIILGVVLVVVVVWSKVGRRVIQYNSLQMK